MFNKLSEKELTGGFLDPRRSRHSGADHFAAARLEAAALVVVERNNPLEPAIRRQRDLFDPHFGVL